MVYFFLFFFSTCRFQAIVCCDLKDFYVFFFLFLYPPKIRRPKDLQCSAIFGISSSFIRIGCCSQLSKLFFIFLFIFSKKSSYLMSSLRILLRLVQPLTFLNNLISEASILILCFLVLVEVSLSYKKTGLAMVLQNHHQYHLQNIKFLNACFYRLLLQSMFFVCIFLTGHVNINIK